MVFNRVEQRLIIWIASPECVEIDLPFVQLDFRTDQAVWPRPAHHECPAQQGHGSSVGGPSKKNDHACWILVIYLPIVRHFPAGWRAFDSRCGSMTDCPNILVRLRSQMFARLEMESAPDLALPATVVAFNRRLKARFAWWSKYRNHTQRQCHADDSPQDVRLTRPLENRSVVKLNIVRAAKRTPVAEDAIYRDFSSNPRSRERTHQSSMERNPVENLDVFSPFEDQAFHAIKAVEFGLAFRQFRQVPTLGRCRSSNTTLAVELASSIEDAVDCSGSGDPLTVPLSQLAMDRLGSVLAKRTDFLEIANTISSISVEDRL